MSKNRRNGRVQPRIRPGAPAVSTAPAAAGGRDNTDRLIEKAALLAASELETADNTPTPVMAETGEISRERLVVAIQEAERARELAKRRQRDHENARGELDKRREALEKEVAGRRAEMEERSVQLEALKEDIETHEAELKREWDELAQETKRLHAWETRLFALEQAARADFADYRHEQIERLREELERRRVDAEHEALRRDRQIAAERAEAELKLAERASGLDANEVDLARREQLLHRRERSVAAREEDLRQELDDRAVEVEARFAGDLDRLRLEVEAWKQRHQMVAGLAQERAEELAVYGASELTFGGRPLPEVAAELERLRKDNAGLRSALAARPETDQERLRELETRCQELTVDREELLRKNEEAQRLIAASRMSVAEQQTMRLVNDALEGQNETLRREIAAQTTKWEELQAENEQRSPFPACSAMDFDPRLAEEPVLRVGVPRLSALVRRVRAAIARDERLHYSERDIRCFLGGLAASRLHLLQGISGIGKTRLPLAFAQAIGASCETVAVAAEWRSPQDLMGYYNAFERKFYETEFTQALYRAQLPLFRKKPFFIVLDEMNLSHPEQYFSDLLHALELRESGPQHLRLMTARVDPAPRLLRDGRDLELPDNVWFVGTANHDETTVSFADKTYDRAHVLELPAKPEPFVADDSQPLDPVSLDALTAAFAEAEASHAGDATRALEFFETVLGDRLRDSFGISWGSRLERQARRFVPVVRSAGGEVGEAADHLLATKVLRKLKGMPEAQTPALAALRSEVQNTWPELDDRTQPVESVRVLDEAIRDRGVL